MKTIDLINQVTAKANQSVNGIFAYKEYIMTQLNKVASFLGRISDSSVINDQLALCLDSIPGYSNSIICAITGDEYWKALNGDELVEVITSYSNGVANKIKVASDKVVTAVEDNVTDLKCQEAFFDYCLEGRDLVSSTEFYQRLNSATSGVAPIMMEKYKKLIDMCSTPIDALKSFFQGAINTFFTRDPESDVIEMVDGKLYEGNAFTAAWTNIGQEISSFFTATWEGILKIGEFMKQIGEGITKFGKWLVGNMFPSLRTVYVKQNNKPVGYMDLPLLQVNFGGLSGEQLLQYTSILNLLRNIFPLESLSDYKLYKWDGCNDCFDLQDDNGVGTTSTILSQGIYDATHMQDDSGSSTIYQTVTDIIIPSSPYDCLLRFGSNTKEEVIMHLYCCLNGDVLDTSSDEQIESDIQKSVVNALYSIRNVAPNWASQQNVDDVSTHFMDLSEAIIPSSLTGDLYADISNLSFNVNLLEDLSSLDVWQKSVILSLVYYGIMMGRGNVNVPCKGKIVVPHEEDALFSTMTLYTPAEDEGYILELDQAYEPGTLTTTFRPYNKENLLPVTVHYQTTQERAKEIQNVIATLVIGAIVVCVTVKVLSWKKNRKMNTDLAKARMDSLAWSASENPTPENLSLYKKARQKFLRMSRLNGILGLASSTDVISNSVNPLLTNLLDTIIPTSQSGETDIKAILDLIR